MTDRSNMAWYVCGPMSGVPRFNYPMFDLIAANLRLQPDRKVISPTELDSKLMQDLARASLDGDVTKMTNDSGETWGDVLARDVRLIEKEVGYFALLPGWERSRGARLEVFVGLLVGVTEFRSLFFDHKGAIVLIYRSCDTIRETIRENMP
jgi:Domain of unknown function (DUF4406)